MKGLGLIKRRFLYEEHVYHLVMHHYYNYFEQVKRFPLTSAATTLEQSYVSD